jgi:hypothetical protein
MKKKKVVRPRLFVGSSKESLDYAHAIHQNLDDDAVVTVWSQGIFQLTKTAVESLVRALDNTDFAVFVFAPDDALRLRTQDYSAVRDNVVFELGLFMGKLGPKRTFIVVPKGGEDLRIPTDLAGITPGTFDSEREKEDGNTQAAFGPFCTQVRKQLRAFQPSVTPKVRRPAARTLREKGKLLVTDAAYGVQDHRVEVTAQLNALIADGKLHTYVGNQLAGDPAPNTPKNLIVKYRHKNKVFEKTLNEGETLDLP